METDIDCEQIERIILDEMTDYFIENDFSDEHRESNRFHLRRYVHSIAWLQALKHSSNRVLELGSPSISTRILHRFFPDQNIVNSNFELRETFPYVDKSFDLVINMEVIEHISDITALHNTTLSGVKHVLSECHRILADNGRMFLTTPNASSLWVIKRALRMEPPMLYEGHFREFTFKEIVELLQQAGFHIEKAATEQVWHLWDFSDIEWFLKKKKYSSSYRGDCTFVVASNSPVNSELSYQAGWGESNSVRETQAIKSPQTRVAEKIKSLMKRHTR